MTQPDPLVGQLLGGRFLVESFLGQGGMATVYRAQDQTLGREVALKILPETLMGETEYVQRFLREALSIQAMDHPNVVRIFAQGTELGRPYYAMEYLPFPDLEQHLRDQGCLSQEETLEIALGLMRALEFTHERALFHRDIKPSNVVIAPGPRPVLMDFGLVKDMNRTQLTATGAIMGTPLYMSPELINGEMAEAPSDIYQVGLLVFEMLSGEKAHSGTSMVEVAHKVMMGEFDPVERFVPDLPADWVNLVHNMLENDPAHRYQSSRDVVRDLLRLRRGQPVARRAAADAATAALGRATPTPGAKAGLVTGPLGTQSQPPHPSGAFRPDGLTASHLKLAPGEKPPLPRWVGVAFLLAVVTVVSSMVDLRGDHRPQEVVVEAGLSGFRVRWTTPDACPSSVQVRGGHEADWRAFYPSQPEAEGGVTQHAVDVGGFEQGDELEFRIVLREGETSPSRTVTLPRFKVSELRLVAGRKGGLGLRLRTSTRSECFLSYQDGEAGAELPLTSDDGQVHALELDRLGVAWRRLRLLATTEAGDIVEEDLSGHFARRAEELVESFSEMDIETVVTGILLDKQALDSAFDRLTQKVKGETPEQRRERRRRAERLLLEFLDKSTPYGAIEELRRMVPWVLSSPEVPAPVRSRAYQALDRFFELAWFAHDKGLERLIDQVSPDWGVFQEAAASRLPEGARVIPVPLGGKADFGTVLSPAEARYEVVLDEVPDPNATVELALRVKGTMKDEMGLRIHVNEAMWVSFYGRRTALQEGTQFFQGFPAFALRKGRNELRVKILNMVGNVSASSIYVKALELRLPP